MKKLFVLISDCGDGSFVPHFTFNEKWIEEQDRRSDNGELEYDSIGCDADGFHYTVLTVPDECTLATLGVLHDCAK